MKLLRAIRLDPSDTLIFEKAAEPGDILVPGSFVFWHADPAGLAGKVRMAFRSGFLSVRNGGFSTLAQVSTVTADERDAAIEALASLLVAAFGAPDLAAARPAAQEEIAASEGLAQHAPDTLVALHRALDESGEITEQFRTLQRRAEAGVAGDPRHYRAFTFFESDTDMEAERVDFAALIGARDNGRTG